MFAQIAILIRHCDTSVVVTVHTLIFILVVLKTIPYRTSPGATDACCHKSFEESRFTWIPNNRLLVRIQCGEHEEDGVSRDQYHCVTVQRST